MRAFPTEYKSARPWPMRAFPAEYNSARPSTPLPTEKGTNLAAVMQ